MQRYQRPYTSPLSSTALLQNLHWLPIEWQVHFKLATLAYKALHTGQPPSLSELLQHHKPTRTLRPSSSSQLSVPRHNLEFGSRAFQISAPKVWNLLPASIRNSPSLPTFCQHLKHIIFSQPILTPNIHPLSSSQRALILYRRWRSLYKSFTYLLIKVQTYVYNDAVAPATLHLQS